MSRWSPGEQVARRFIVEGWLASGGMAEVYVAEMILARSVKKRVALKRIHTHLAEDHHFLTMFLDEARVASQLTHPGIVAVHDVVEEEEEVLLVLDYVPGWDLSTILKTARRDLKYLPIGMAITFGMDIAETLAYVHTAQGHSGAMLNIVHRDVNPSNILVAEDGTIRLLDFGVAKAAERVHQTATASIKGKLAYLAPEQASIGAVVDHRADIYGLGLILYEIVTGRRAIYGDGDLHLLEMAKAPQHRPVTDFRPEAPVALANIISRLLATDPADRPKDGHAVVAELEPLRSSVTDTQREKIRSTVGDLMGLSSRPVRKPSVPKANSLDAAFAQVAGVKPPRPKTQPIRGPARAASPLGELGSPASADFISNTFRPGVGEAQASDLNSELIALPDKTRSFKLLAFAASVFVAAILFALKFGPQETDSAVALVGYIRVTSKPTGSAITIDGKPWPEVTPSLIQSKLGALRRITVEHVDHEPKTFEASAEKDEPTILHAALIRKSGLIKIVTEPSSAEIFVDGKSWRRTPQTKLKLPRKKFVLVFKKEGYQTSSVEVDLTTEADDAVVVKLQKTVAYGTLDVSSHPWARVYIDNKLVAESTPAYGLKVAEGKHTIRFENPRKKKYAEKAIVIMKNQTQRLVVKLE
jgi:serine/threonine protein kinase